MTATPVLSADPFTDFKAKQREGWSKFAALELTTTPPAARLVAFAASLLILIGLYLHRRAYKPLVDAREELSGEAPWS